MVCLEVLLETRDLGLKRGRGSSLLHSLLYSTNCRYHRIRRAPRASRTEMEQARAGLGEEEGGVFLSHKGGKMWEGEQRVA